MVNIELEINDTIHLKITGHVHEYNNLKNEELCACLSTITQGFVDMWCDEVEIINEKGHVEFTCPWCEKYTIAVNQLLSTIDVLVRSYQFAFNFKGGKNNGN